VEKLKNPREEIRDHQDHGHEPFKSLIGDEFHGGTFRIVRGLLRLCATAKTEQ
jgi:hypothetical protein